MTSISRTLPLIVTIAASALAAGAASAATIVADTVIDYNVEGITAGLDTSGVLTDDSSYVSLPTYTDTASGLTLNSFATLGFSTGYIVDAAGQDDLFVGEIGNGNEDADVFVSTNWGATFTYLGVAYGNAVSTFDLATLGIAGIKVTAVKVVGLDRGGSAPGFDLDFISGLEGSSVIGPHDPLTTVPLPATLPLLLAGLGGTTLLRRRRKQ
ncbi:VPLPA-CTERM protein sorting domain-containing protein [Poseidonocella pacifica]|uniref:VPLPA-CTERM protein sorting domain-containing protein n=1 Tax=Poseidonocella pacifica TaxID=871651 RepID=A0A1I0W915_9RHOB|nr:VPLPA-CTERM sorting domain-containing protein [Poseidonocella pacifica]SFA85054.1 VPLPA-CTERM protein sorting domain-containing protein [Poseidonocella pacifica]